MASVNKVILIGRLGKDPELRKTPAGASVAEFSLATSEKYKDKQGQQQEATEWHNVVLWNKQAELACQYLNKGSMLYVEGKLKTESWEDNGQKRYKTTIVGMSMQFLDSKPQQQGQQQPQFNAQAHSIPPQAMGNYSQQQPMQPQQPMQGGFPPQEDDLPF